jgi:dTDP-4-dehydrorhamnose reductase
VIWQENTVQILVLGAGGQLGRELVVGAPTWGDDEVVGCDRSTVDVTDADSVQAALTQHQPDVVIDCAAWTDVDGCELDAERAHRVNAHGAKTVAEVSAAAGVKVVHVSTDFVFGEPVPLDADGHRRGWLEDDAVAPLNVYGASKAAGDAAVLAAWDQHVVVRTSWVCGVYGGNFVRTMLRVGRGGGVMTVVDDQWGSPTFTADLAPALLAIAASDIAGTVHRTNQGSCTWFDLAAATFEEAGLDVDLRRQPSSALERPAARPAWSVLTDTRAAAHGLAPLPAWRDGLAGLVHAYDGVDLS